MRVGLLVSHPIQYHSPWFRVLAERLELQVFYCLPGSPRQQAEAGFGVPFQWDVDLFSGYVHTLLKNISNKPSSDWYGGCDTPEISRVIATEKFDVFVVLGWYLKSYWQAVRACRRERTPVLVRGDSQLRTRSFFLKRALKELTHHLALRQFDGFLSVGQRNREYLVHYGVPEDRIFNVPHFVDNAWFARQAQEVRDQRSDIRNRWGIRDDAFCVLFCGKFIPKKRPLDLIKAAQSLLQNNRLPNIHLLFVGSGELGAELRASCNVLFDGDPPSSQLPAPGSETKPPASFAGFLNQTEISRAYVAADSLVLPSDGGETWGLVVNEAMACGLPAIVSDAAGCAPDLIDESKTGFTFRVGDPAQLAQRLAIIFEMKQRGHNFRSALAEKMLDYSLDAAVDGTLVAAETLAMRRCD